MKKVVIYTRVSTRDQNPQMQIVDLRDYAKAHNFKVAKEYVNYGSGSKNDRENYLKMLDDVRK